MNLKKALNKFAQAEVDKLGLRPTFEDLANRICTCEVVDNPDCSSMAGDNACMCGLVDFYLAFTDLYPSCDEIKGIIARIIECLTDNPFEGKEGAGLTDYSSQQWIDLLRKMLEHYCGGDDPEDTDQKVLPGEGI